MKKLLALSGLGSAVTFWAMTTVVPKVVAILLVLVLNGQPGAITFATGTSIARDLVGFSLGFFDTSSLANLFIGL